MHIYVHTPLHQDLIVKHWVYHNTCLQLSFIWVVKEKSEVSTPTAFNWKKSSWWSSCVCQYHWSGPTAPVVSTKSFGLHSTSRDQCIFTSASLEIGWPWHPCGSGLFINGDSPKISRHVRLTPWFAHPPRWASAMEDLVQGQHGSEELQKHWVYAMILWRFMGLGFQHFCQGSGFSGFRVFLAFWDLGFGSKTSALHRYLQFVKTICL